MINIKLQKKKYKVTIVGSGYVGMSLAVLLSLKNYVKILEIDQERIKKINAGNIPIVDPDMTSFVAKNDVKIEATNNKDLAYHDCDFIIISTPTDYSNKTNSFDTSIVEEVAQDALEINHKALIVIKSTIPVGFTDFLQKKFKTTRIIFSPEFLREGQALFDNLYPSRVIIGGNCKKSKIFAGMLTAASKKKSVDILYVSPKEAEAIKLFSNTYLAMRVSFFNELDSFALSNEIDTKKIIDGVCLDKRIGDGYNNPSFGYGGYCLPKDTKQLLANYDTVPQTLMNAIVTSNQKRKDFIVETILKTNPKTVGFYRLVMKKGSDNFRSSAVLGIIDRLKKYNINILIYEPNIIERNYHGGKIENDFLEFKNLSDIIVANRLTNSLDDVIHKVFTRDLYGIN